jgi:hypothetical protein
MQRPERRLQRNKEVSDDPKISADSIVGKNKRAGGGGECGFGGAGGCGGYTPQRRRLDSSGVDKLHADTTISLLRSRRNRWNDFTELSQLITFTPA